MFSKVLIANRGEIAVTVIRACRDLGIQTVAVCSEADRNALHACLADECVCIGPASSKDSYLNMQAILSACLTTGAEAIHPGFGFLSENPQFARLCEKCGITFIGPTASLMEQMGNKANARSTAESAGVPVIPGSKGILRSVTEAKEEAKSIGFPVMIKASAGGGGRGMRVAQNETELEAAYSMAKAEAKACFGDDEIYMEKLVIEPRHIEIQLLCDGYGHAVHLGDRDCSVQRRNQKVIEEASSPFMTEELRILMGDAAVCLSRKIGYIGVGTIEFLVDKERNFYFMEMNTRIQVEHPISEAITGVNLVEEQIRVAAGEVLRFSQRDIVLKGHAIECRINAEDPENDFRPCPGIIETLILPGGQGVRVDSAIYPGYEVPPHYDSLLSKVIVWAPTREEAIVRMRRALTEFVIVGVKTNIDFHLSILSEPDFIAGIYDNTYLTKRMKNNG
ncbi:MAG TPA: acetyl-CoA carboxylase biotin carboxylase subunit [Bacillota bacterium]|nr:acetyl-CoA carboxylase biotin carboxylase subunit [Bacillota bacterium]HPE38216.1 acetyl-CoA carboxylase biotin carboxylase subunit [Bacillota bacterium]